VDLRVVKPRKNLQKTSEISTLNSQAAIFPASDGWQSCISRERNDLIRQLEERGWTGVDTRRIWQRFQPA
jgi:hypothetical protein